jgi:hypothetical protein
MKQQQIKMQINLVMIEVSFKLPNQFYMYTSSFCVGVYIERKRERRRASEVKIK